MMSATEVQAKGRAWVSKKRWADMCAVLRRRFGDGDATRTAMQELQEILQFDPEVTTSSDAQRERVRKLRQRHKLQLAKAAACPTCSQSGCAACASGPPATSPTFFSAPDSSEA